MNLINTISYAKPSDMLPGCNVPVIYQYQGANGNGSIVHRTYSDGRPEEFGTLYTGGKPQDFSTRAEAEAYLRKHIG